MSAVWFAHNRKIGYQDLSVYSESRKASRLAQLNRPGIAGGSNV